MASLRISLLLIPLLAGCAVPHEETPAIGVAIPAQFHAADAEAAVADGQWWKGFGDPQLDWFVEKVTTDNVAIGRAIAQVRQARARARMAGADRLPQADIGLSAQKQRLSLESLGILLPEEGVPGLPPGQNAYEIETYSLSGNISWEIDLWGKLSAQTVAARAEWLGREANLQGARQAMAAQTARAYFALVEAQGQVELARKSAEIHADRARHIGHRVAAGSAQPTDGQAAEADLGRARAILAEREETLARLSRTFDVLLRNYPDGKIATAADLPEMPPAPPAGIPADVLARRPDISAALLDLHAAGYRLTAAERSFLPAITLTGSAGTSSTELSNIFDPDFFVWSIAGHLLQPVFQGGRLRAQLQLRAGERDEALQAYADTVLNAFSEIETALAAEKLLSRHARELAAALAAAERMEEIARNRVQVGKESPLVLLESQSRTIDARASLLAVRRARLANRVDLHLALGGGFADVKA